ncbi:spore germination protein [Bacillus paranthracis]|uniref:spore germination protein n=1 Tax=Bacillus paranthracis TaxID=2026186 RepID=UPI0039A1B566
MPSVVGNLVVQNSNGSFNLGDFYNVSPKENTKAYNGSGASNVGFVVNTFNGVSATNTCNYSASSNKKTGQIHVSDSKT